MVTHLELRCQQDYAVGNVLGTGGFSVVHKAVHCKDGSSVAIKTIKKVGFVQPSSFRSGRNLPLQIPISETLLANEILVMRHIVEEVFPHPNVIHLHDVYEDEVGVHFVLELCSGGELFDRIVASKCYSEAAAATVIRQIASGLKALHASHIVHRDLKPENCLFLTVEDDSPVKIMDFGLSQIEGITNPVVGMFGSIDYVAPEVLEKRMVLPASDMWSLGVILYILLCGQKDANFIGVSAQLITDSFGQIRTSSHQLEIEFGRFQGIPLEDRLCKLCGTEPETELHYGLLLLLAIQVLLLLSLRILFSALRGFHNQSAVPPHPASCAIVLDRRTKTLFADKAENPDLTVAELPNLLTEGVCRTSEHRVFTPAAVIFRV
ncbi:hypothetical protein L7F22_023324 [Adiantum nelumboides]|nr:hypothetical protein [Adiantum nelumboides]